ncbi:CHAP domain-containing protein [Staphylococcus devriesei]|uniref:glucosaminidase domain-containing protein n=1 Tax=Staphylococcus devriesei TaxID=586733 RepID=UPI000E678A99|nr:glucosaminidase domain-containing protein [Staphylococcus devriesei]RIL72716.1 CHAP domain-containing protein [Staphylococcus devriesei]
MGLPNPKSRKPTASEVAAWARSMIGKRVDVDGYHGAQCWDTPNYIFQRYWGFRTTGNAIAMAWYRYPKGFKFYRNTPDFVPKPGDMAVWGTGSFNNGVGHTAIVVGPSNTNYFTSVDQNWYHANGYTGSPGAIVKHTYYGISGFVRPPYQPEKKTSEPKKDTPKPTTPKPTVPSTSPTIDKNTTPETKPTTKKVKKVEYTDFLLTLDKQLEYNYHLIIDEGKQLETPKGIYIKECPYLRDVEELYLQRKRYVSDDEYPHVYIDRERIWTPRSRYIEAPEHPGWLVLEVCGAQTESKRQFMLNQIQALVYGVWMLSWSKIKLSESSIKVDENIWRTMKDLIDYDMIKNGVPDKAKYKDVEKKIIEMYLKRDQLRTETITTTTIKKTIKLKPTETAKDTKKATTPAKNTTGVVSGVKEKNAKITVEKSNYSFKQALNLQLSKGYPQISNGVSWYRPTNNQVKNAMNPTTIFNSKTQIYQFLNLGKYQGVSVEKLNIILKGKGTLAGQGKAFAEGCKKYNINEIYLIAHALLESGNGTSNYASGRYGIYNYFGIGAYDNNPDNAIPFARRRGWTTPAKAIIGGAKFVRQDFINVGQNTLYRMRWNPKHPGTHQYATDIRWCSHQASTIYSYYKKIGLKGLYFIRDNYK